MKARSLFSLPVAFSVPPGSVKREFVDVIIYFGQSNALGIDTARPILAPFPPTRYLLRRIAEGTFYESFQDLYIAPDFTHGSELSFGPLLYTSGYDNATLKCTRGSTSLDEWIVGTANYNDFVECIDRGRSQLATNYPGQIPRYHLAVSQGEEEARAATSGPALAWPGHLANIVGGLSTHLGVILRPHITLTQSTIAGGTFIIETRTSQMQAAINLNGWTVESDGIPTLPDNIHYTSPGEYLLGERQHASFLLELP